MNTHNPKFTKWVKRITGSLLAITLVITTAGAANARILFEDDEWFNIESEGIILDQNDNMVDGTLSTGTYTMVDAACVAGETFTATINGTAVVYTATTTDCAGGDTADTAAVLQGLTAAINNNYTVGHIIDAAYSANTITVTAEVADPANNFTTTAGDTSTAGTLTATGANLTGGVLGDTVEIQLGNDGTDAVISYDPNNEKVTLSAPGDSFDFTDADLRTTGALQFQGSSEFHIREVTDEATAACTNLDEIVLDTTENLIYICTGVGNPGTWASSAPAATVDLQSAYDQDGAGAHEISLAAGGSNPFEIIANANGDTLFSLENSGGTSLIDFLDSGGNTIDINSLIVDWDATGAFNLDSTTAVHIGAADASDFTVASDGAGDDLTIAVTGATDSSVVLNSSGTGTDAIDLNATAGGITVDAAGALSFQGAADSDITTTGTSDISINAGDDVIFDDAQLTGIVQLTSNPATTDWNPTFNEDGIVDNINSFALTTNGNGASNVGIEDASAWFTGAEIEAALNEIETLFGSTTSNTFNFTEDNVLADNDPVYTALNKLDLKWGDLASTANGEGASLVGIEDAGAYLTATDVEGAIQEIAGDLYGANYEILTFYPEYQNAVVHADGTNNKGTLESFYDTGEDSGYYEWTTNNGNQQDIDIRFTVFVPEDFNATGDVDFRFRTGTTTAASNDVEVIMYNVTDAATCFTDNDNNSANVWATQNIPAATINAGCAGLSADDQIEFQIKLLDDTGAADWADMAWIDWAYTK
ncbi:hypothetical protein JXD20_04735 [Candidatus Peregrinibacteria bacterium]|nr:hypothetical protein [Candidatus Peregrinibacteria bacterium]